MGSFGPASIPKLWECLRDALAPSFLAGRDDGGTESIARDAPRGSIRSLPLALSERRLQRLQKPKPSGLLAKFRLRGARSLISFRFDSSLPG